MESTYSTAGGPVTGRRLLLACLFLITCFEFSGCQILKPPYFNIAQGRRIHATATCGEGVREPELFCKLVAGPGGAGNNLIQGQYCDYCDPDDTQKYHPIQYAIDGTERWWQSPPLSRGDQYNEVNVTIDLGQLFHVAYVILKFANSPRPGIWVLEHSVDNGETYESWQYFAPTPSECYTYFQMPEGQAILTDDTVICTDDYSPIVPLEDGEIHVSLVNSRPGSSHFFSSPTLQEWTKATNIRLRFIQTNTLLGHLMAKARQDPTVTRRYFYSIKDISIGGRCFCNGHADLCDTLDENDNYKLYCTCQHNTCGENCERCCDGFVQKPWKAATETEMNECEACNCFGHSTECYYDEDVASKKQSLDIFGQYNGGGVCQNCEHNTAGINCDKCEAGFYRPRGVSKNSVDVCRTCRCSSYYHTGNCQDETAECECLPQYTGPDCSECSLGYFNYPQCEPCECNYNGTNNAICNIGGGQCPCKSNYAGTACDRCAQGYYNFPQCMSCDCDRSGGLSFVCDTDDGQCLCRSNFAGRDCSECASGYFNYPNCFQCSCHELGVIDEVCSNQTGQCYCDDKYVGSQCDSCAPGFYNFPQCQECRCNALGSLGTVCSNSGQCPCLQNFAGRQCDQCAPGYYSYPECKPCECDRSGSYSASCDAITGQCQCYSNFDGVKCDHCSMGTYNFPSCEECNCDPAGVKNIPGRPPGDCILSTGLCDCKQNVEGSECSECKQLYWNIHLSNPRGCEPCDCYLPGTNAGIGNCDQTSGQCSCKPHSGNRQCSECTDTFYRLEGSSIFGCENCGCDVGGADHSVCDKQTGQCVCHPRITGRQCDRPLRQHFVPDFYQYQFEIEDSLTPEGSASRFHFDPTFFPGFSWRGYSYLSSVQPIVIYRANIEKPSLYRIIIHYVNPSPTAVTVELIMTPINGGIEQSSSIIFPPSAQPNFVTVPGGGAILPFVIDPGQWSFTFQSDQEIHLDYFVLLPSSYYEAGVLQKKVTDACLVTGSAELCAVYAYPPISTMYPVEAETGYYTSGRRRQNTRLFTDTNMLRLLGTDSMAYISPQQPTVMVKFANLLPGDYVFIIGYFNPVLSARTQDLYFRLDVNGRSQEAVMSFYDCMYTFACRTVAKDTDGKVSIFYIDTDEVDVTLGVSPPASLAIDWVLAIPIEDWNVDYVIPKLKCVQSNDQCFESRYPTPPGSVELEGIIPGGSRDPRESLGNIKPETLVYLEGSQNYMVASGYLPSMGDYVFVIHYNQPDHASFTGKFTVDGTTSLEGHFNVEFCPHISGCRSLVVFSDDTVAVNIPQAFVYLSVTTPPDVTIWIDYVLVIPSQNAFTTPDAEKTPENFDYTILEPLSHDETSTFLTQCAGDSFRIDSSVSAIYCQKGVFSLSADHNHGALECGCDFSGSTSLECGSIGGQCSCRPHIIGRTCSRCQTGYYGFPNCRPCQCGGGLCDEMTGQCICPPRVSGPNCNVCQSGTFGFDPLAGCEDCDCHPTGVANGDMVCDATTGQCNCKTSIGGRRCDQCMPGYYGYPYCISCGCDTKGTVNTVCDAYTQDCQCKGNVQGRECNQCKFGTFFLEERNDLGCSSCFCSGISRSCSSTYMQRSQIENMMGWSVTNVEHPYILSLGQSVRVQVNGERVDPNKAVYWIAPEDYLGNKLTSYGGVLEYSIRYTNLRGDVSAVTPTRRPDVVLRGSGFTIVHSDPIILTPDQRHSVSLDLTENKFLMSDGSTVSRDKLMMVLANLSSLEIRASYRSRVLDITLSNVLMDVASETAFGNMAMNVEQCDCPAPYTGLSCELCIAGYYRVTDGSGLNLGVCVACNCNGHADSCDPATGQCSTCRDNTMGVHCDECATGYYGDATQGQAYSCLPCPCPSTDPDNNYAQTCGVSPYGNIVCQCLEGYAGSRCEQCADGYFGDPTVPGGRCIECDCNGNSDPRQSGQSCDPVTGECLVCAYSTTGPHCDICAEGYYGDAHRHTCQPCPCDRCGTESCDPVNGACTCKTNVVGTTCDSCTSGTWDYDSCGGCVDCACSGASLGAGCDVVTGQCDCRYGVGGRDCTECSPTFWDYTPYGCRSCNCPNNLPCEELTGECKECEPREIMTPDGCQQCDDCTDTLLDIVYILNYNITLTIDGLRGVSVGVAAFQRLQDINDTAQALNNNLQDQVEENVAIETDLDDLNRALQRANRDANRVSPRVRSALSEAGSALADADETLAEANRLEPLVNETYMKVKDVVQFIEDLLENLGHGAGGDFTSAIREARRILTDIRRRDFFTPSRAAIDELDAAEELLDRAKDAFTDVLAVWRDLYAKLNEVMDLIPLFEELMDHTADAVGNVYDANILNLKNRNPLYKDIVDYLNVEKANIDANLMMAEDLLDAARDFLDNATAAIAGTELEKSKLDGVKMLLDRLVDLRFEQIDELTPLVDNATEHARKLERQAAMLVGLIQDTREFADDALAAANAYQAIVDAINDAEKAAMDAQIAADEALDMSSGPVIDASEAKQRSYDLLDEAYDVLENVEGELTDKFNNAVAGTDDLSSKLLTTQNDLQMINDELDKLGQDNLGDMAVEALDVATRADTTANKAEDKVQDIADKIPGLQDKINNLPGDIDGANDALNSAASKIRHLNTVIVDMITMIEEVTTVQENVTKLSDSVSYDISEIRRKIDVARHLSNELKLAMNFEPGISVMPRMPPAVDATAIYTTVSMYVRTTDRDGLLMYLGRPLIESSRRKRQLREDDLDDYLALEVVDGKVALYYDLGNGYTEIVNPRGIADNQWHNIGIIRSGKYATLIVGKKGEDDVIATGESIGSSVLLDVNENSHLYVGGLQPGSEMPSSLHSDSFSGCIDELEILGEKVGLWNFETTENSNDSCTERDTSNEVSDSSMHFTGTGYIVLIRRSSFRPFHRADLVLQFRTYAENGLLFFACHEQKDFISLEIVDGHIVFQYDLGSGRAVLESPERYNTGEWFLVEAVRRAKDGYLRVNNVEVVTGESPGELTGLSVSNDLFIGGVPEIPHEFRDIMFESFRGCIKDLQLSRTFQDLYDNSESLGVSEGCSSPGVRLAYYAGESYTALPVLNVGENVVIQFSFKTTETEGLIFYVSNDAQSSTLSVSVVDGAVVFKATGGGNEAVQVTQITSYNDGQWHYVYIHKDQGNFEVLVDDTESLDTALAGGLRLTTTTPVYVAGVPIDDLPLLAGVTATPIWFTGCVRDFIINNELQDFSNPIKSENVLLDTCKVEPVAATTELPRSDVGSETGVVTFDPDAGLPTLPPVPRTTTPDKVAACVLPPEMADMQLVRDDGSLMFGNTSDARQEFNSMPANIKNRFNFTFLVKTSDDNGLLFYVADDAHSNYISLYMLQGLVVFSFDCGSGYLTLNSDRSYNDGQWHKLSIVRQKKNGELYIDGVMEDSGRTSGREKSISVVMPYYLGGTPFYSPAYSVPPVSQYSFEGCIKDPLLNDRDFNSPVQSVNVMSCSPPSENGAYFGSDGGYILYDTSFVIGLDLELKFDIRPRTATAVLFYVVSDRSDFLAIELLNGKLVVTVQNSEREGSFETAYDPATSGDPANLLCDGNWHNIKVEKDQSSVLLTVDDVLVFPWGSGTQKSTDTRDPLYIGGVPAGVNNKGLSTSEPFVGCMKNLYINSELHDIADVSMVVGDINPQACPLI